ncbi:MAG TPA: DNA repair protein RadA [Cyclobacteriaceae bacterium]|nr:DNA repair protein RadA [Cyclobacteriaceae bacterium]MCB0498696.1 DNA repair protein RadA [Cyclobacteriaceae bacterium]MCB9237792.1 DNA repair protein RadA [Flammeovirgaceae bacterium]MCW5903155.1 DNA repair protein RadA [Cyclobacteriaceae bacterium]HOO09819.1 DNA repair protein RadA [Cyclobacteriaceae bacterium]
MPKSKIVFFCQNCGHQSAKWVGKCPSCNEWNTFVEEVVETQNKNQPEWRQGTARGKAPMPKSLNEIEATSRYRIHTPDNELNRVLGGGIIPGSLILIGGEPGIGKSTLMLQIGLALKDHKILYVSGEESEQQIKMRAERLTRDESKAVNFFTLAETSTKNIFAAIATLQPQLVIIDSIQTLHSQMLESAAGSIGQVRQCTAELMKFAKEANTPVFLVGHITKDGMLAGPKVLEHMVDTVLQFEGDRHLAYRILRTVKNRFGPTSELGIYEMLGTGLREVSNPSEILISQKEGQVSGATIGATMEGNRPLLIEIQSLVSAASYGTPQRTSTGFDHKRLNMLLAVLEKRCGFRMGAQDVFVNMAGGIKVEDPAIDLAVCISIISSAEEIPVSDKFCFAAEVGLGGELRAVNRIDQRISEAGKLGFKEIYVSRYNQKSIDLKKAPIEVKAFGKLSEVVQDLFG